MYIKAISREKLYKKEFGNENMTITGDTKYRMDEEALDTLAVLLTKMGMGV